MGKKITMQHVADAAGVSKYVVSKSLSGKGGVNPATRERVLQVAAKLGYRFHARPTNVSQGTVEAIGKTRKSTVVVLLPNIRYQLRDSVYWGRIVDGITQELQMNGSRAVVITDQTADSFLSLVDEDNIQGFIGVGQVSTQVLQEAGKLEVPIVLIDHREPLVKSSELFANNRECVYHLTNHLLSLGHRFIYFVGNIDYSFSFLSRWNGYKDAMEEAGLPVSKHHPLSCLEGENRVEHTEQIRAILESWKGRNDFPTALVCANDAIAICAINALKSLNVRIPQEVSITGFDNIEDAFFTEPALTTVNVEKELMGRRAVQVLFNHMTHTNFPRETLYMSGSIVYRDSSGQAPQKGITTE
ncbi:sugar-binding domain protein [Paenibacillus sp. oral taxon 786 str. D14]|uniref:LacI family DNA-binding transcriptional regulator n=1 Tax=Paenibacillus sp. oral taxon 786 TaxID=652715 RepID=UPI0001AFCD76|nr:LacI family DNA-binding transcriptional regulator [Paenibacillus sp. oral taxon 786]EES73700.1 sugar-binding domain protein [Paenibacillus sp. oral taxon 786 str. D14]